VAISVALNVGINGILQSSLENWLDNIVGVKTQSGYGSGVEEELLSPVPSRHLVENLVRENSRLKQQIGNPRKSEELRQVWSYPPFHGPIEAQFNEPSSLRENSVF